MTTLKSYPWSAVKKGQGFFIPALDLEATKEAGLLAAVREHITDARAVFRVRLGLLGVWFYRAGHERP